MGAEEVRGGIAGWSPWALILSRRRSVSAVLGLRFYLLALAAAVTLPLLALAGLEASDAIAARRSEADVQMRLLLDDITHGLTQGLDAMTATAEVLARSPSLATSNIPAFREQAKNVASIRGVDVVLRDPAGAQLLATRVPDGAPLPTLPPEDRDGRAAVNAGSNYVSDVYSSGMTHPFLARIIVPAKLGTRSGYSVEVAFPPEIVGGWLNTDGMPLGWVVCVVGRNGLIVAHSGDPSAYVGRGTARDAYGPATGYRGSWEGFANDGQPLTGVYTKLPSGWLVSVGAPNHLLARPMRVTLLWLVVTAVLLILIGLTAATLLGRRIDSSVAQLAEAAKALGDGSLVMPEPLPVRDLDFVRAAMCAAGRDIAARRINELTLLGKVEAGRDLLQAVVDGSEDLIFARDPQKRVVLANQATAALCGLPSGTDAVGRRLDELIPEGDWPDIAPLASAEPGNTSRFLSGDGRLFEVSHSPLRDGSAHHVGTISIAREVTQRVATEARLGRLQSDPGARGPAECGGCDGGRARA